MQTGQPSRSFQAGAGLSSGLLRMMSRLRPLDRSGRRSIVLCTRPLGRKGGNPLAASSLGEAGTEVGCGIDEEVAPKGASLPLLIVERPTIRPTPTTGENVDSGQGRPITISRMEGDQRRSGSFSPRLLWPNGRIGGTRAMTGGGRQCELGTAPVSCHSRQESPYPTAAVCGHGELRLSAGSGHSGAKTLLGNDRSQGGGAATVGGRRRGDGASITAVKDRRRHQHEELLGGRWLAESN